MWDKHSFLPVTILALSGCFIALSSKLSNMAAKSYVS